MLLANGVHLPQERLVHAFVVVEKEPAGGPGRLRGGGAVPVPASSPSGSPLPQGVAGDVGERAARRLARGLRRGGGWGRALAGEEGGGAAGVEGERGGVLLPARHCPPATAAAIAGGAARVWGGFFGWRLVRVGGRGGRASPKRCVFQTKEKIDRFTKKENLCVSVPLNIFLRRNTQRVFLKQYTPYYYTINQGHLSLFVKKSASLFSSTSMIKKPNDTFSIS